MLHFVALRRQLSPLQRARVCRISCLSIYSLGRAELRLSIAREVETIVWLSTDCVKSAPPRAPRTERRHCPVRLSSIEGRNELAGLALSVQRPNPSCKTRIMAQPVLSAENAADSKPHRLERQLGGYGSSPRERSCSSSWRASFRSTPAKVISGVRSIRMRSGAPAVICSIRQATVPHVGTQIEGFGLPQHRFESLRQDGLVTIK